MQKSCRNKQSTVHICTVQQRLNAHAIAEFKKKGVEGNNSELNNQINHRSWRRKSRIRSFLPCFPEKWRENHIHPELQNKPEKILNRARGFQKSTQICISLFHKNSNRKANLIEEGKKHGIPYFACWSDDSDWR